jgi:hypothetical protein
LAKTLVDLDLKEIELKKQKREPSTHETEIKLLKDRVGEKERQLKKLNGEKSKL